MQVGVLGPLDVVVGDGRIHLGSKKERAILQLLALRGERGCGLADLIDGLWGEEPPPSAAKALQTHVSRLRRNLPENAIRTTSFGYALDVAPDDVDATRFERLAAQGRDLLQAGQAPQAIRVLSSGLGLWRGRALVDIAEHPAGFAEAARLEELRRRVEEDLAAARLSNGEHLAIVGDLEAAVAAEPLREQRWAQLMLALYRSGRQADALRAFQRLRDRLAEEVGIDPSHELVELERAILQQRADLDAPIRPDLPAPADAPARMAPIPEGLPSERTVLVGRDQLVGDVMRAVRDEPLVTLWGPGGVGKTRVAVRVASRLRGPFDDGLAFVDLSVLRRPGQVADTILSVIHGAPAARERSSDAVIRVLRTARMLLVVDNCEHVLDEVGELLSQVIRACPWVHVLTTSREALGIASERRIEVPPLDLPVAGIDSVVVAQANPAVRLFVDRAQKADSTFALTTDNVVPVAEICRRVGGLPLAIELAASRLDVETAEELGGGSAEQQLLHRLARDQSRDEDRASSELASIQWSFDLLSEPEQEMFLALGAFAGTFTREMALELAGTGSSAADRQAFDRLVRSSMIRREAPGSARFRLFVPGQEFARSRLAPAGRESISERHADLMLARAERFGPMVKTSGEAQACAVLRSDFADHRQAMTWLLDSRRWDQGARLLVALFQFCHFQLLAEANGWAANLVTVVPEDSPLFAEVCGAAALGAWFEGDPERAIALGERAVAAEPSSQVSAAYWGRLALINSFGYMGKVDEGVKHFLDFVAAAEASPEKFWQVNGYGYEAIGLLLAGQTRPALSRAERAAAVARQLNNPDCTHWALHCLGRVYASTDPEAARHAFKEAIDATRQVGSRWNLSIDLMEWASATRQAGDLRSAAEALLELLELLRSAGNRSQLAQTFLEAARLLVDHGEAGTAYLLQQARFGLPEMPKGQTGPNAEPEFVARLEEAVGPARARLAVRARSMPEHDLIVLCRSALEEVVRGASIAAGGKQRLADISIVYTDIVASTELNVQVGDDRFLDLLREHNLIVRRRITSFGGTEFAFTGDGVGVMFNEVDEALRFGIGLQADFDDVNDAHPDEPLHVRVGLSRGEALMEEGNLFGQTVVRAIRICSAAQSGQVLAAEEVASTADPALASFSPVGSFPLKGFGVSVPLFEVRPATSTIAAARPGN